MSMMINNKKVTTNELVRIVVCSVLEDLQNNFDEYASLYVKDFNTFSEDEKLKLEQWKAKVFHKLNVAMKKEDLLNV